MSQEAVRLQERLRQQIERDLDQRMAEHRASVSELGRSEAAGGPHRLNLIGIGDSWFDYPLPIASRSDVLAQLPPLLAPAPIVLRLAHAGDTATRTMGVTQLRRFEQALGDRTLGRFDAILVSAGGNDLVGDQFRLWLKDAPPDGDLTKAIDEPAARSIFGVIEAAYLELLEIRDGKAHDVPIFLHGYDFAWPTNVGVCTLGPWLAPSLLSRGWMRDDRDILRGAAVVRLFLQRFDALLARLAQNRLVFRVPTQGTLHDVSEWANELHPTPAGFGKIAQRFADTLTAHMQPAAGLTLADPPLPVV